MNVGNENMYHASMLITIGPDDHVEKYDVSFVFPQLDQKSRQKLKFEIEEAGKVTMPVIVMFSVWRLLMFIGTLARRYAVQPLRTRYAC